MGHLGCDCSFDPHRSCLPISVVHHTAVIRFDLSVPFVLNRRSRRYGDMEVQTDERLLRNLEGYLMELVCTVESMDEVNLIADVLFWVQEDLRYLAQRSQSAA